ncbi:peptidylprolyl isomerase/peptidyl-prolyl cis-trans isomerase SurA [Hydrogenivirga caldilitoris]|uniref:Peptidylprolyl isomerase/peptidyl-prolyl cis-trans isomerase SurA n=1 Tax=Hydrogenivirga caldilitoris TaxID=246264 RepID=A0A497XSR3_9AQUI|nr:peptidylprolyl isomerase [Hydrogenivirga caldilitoris]RLJ71301.1 peptidylprolyl isomerase/peptidyl-prolyl cis-trans isomerase SurA [Hydrogenivirga caldilitoris]
MVQRGTKKLPFGVIPEKLVVFLFFVTWTAFGQLLDRVVANVNGEPILESEIKVAQVFYGIKDRKQLIQLLVQKHLVAQFLHEKGLNIPESYIESVIQDIAKSNGKTIDALYRELYENGLSPSDLKALIRVELASTLGLKEYLMSKVNVTDLEIELERLKRGDIEYLKEIELLVIGKDNKEKLLSLMEKYGTDMDKLANELGEKVEKLKVKKGELVAALDNELWKTKVGDIAVAEDQEHIYLARVVREVKLISGRSEEDIKEELTTKKLKEKEDELIKELRRKSLVEIYG